LRRPVGLFAVVLRFAVVFLPVLFRRVDAFLPAVLRRAGFFAVVLRFAVGRFLGGRLGAACSSVTPAPSSSASPRPVIGSGGRSSGMPIGRSGATMGGTVGGGCSAMVSSSMSGRRSSVNMAEPPVVQDTFLLIMPR
jgi:hypothetical protein